MDNFYKFLTMLGIVLVIFPVYRDYTERNELMTTTLKEENELIGKFRELSISMDNMVIDYSVFVHKFLAKSNDTSFLIPNIEDKKREKISKKIAIEGFYSTLSNLRRSFKLIKKSTASLTNDEAAKTIITYEIRLNKFAYDIDEIEGGTAILDSKCIMFQKNQWWNNLMVLTGLLWSSIGFVLWFFRLQVYLDKLLISEANKKT